MTQEITSTENSIDPVALLTAMTKQRMVSGNKYIAPRGNPKAKVMIVTHQTGVDDVKTGTILSGDSGETVSNVLQAVGMSEKDCWITSIYKYPSSRNVTTAKCKEHLELYLEQEIQLLKPELIITLGAEAFKLLYGSNAKVTDWYGMVIDGKYGKMLATHSPYLVGTIDPMLRTEYAQHFRDAFRYVTQHVYEDWTYEVVKDPQRAREIITGYLNKGLRRMSCDGEWLPGVWNENEVMTDFQFAFEPNHGIVLDISPDLVTENRELLDTLKLAMELPDIELLCWNGKVDLKRLAHRGFKIHDNALKFDGMIAVGFIDSRLRKGLDVSCHHYSNIPPYWVRLYEELKKNDIPRAEMARMKLINPEVWHRYVSGDAVSHFQVNTSMMAEMDRVCDPKAVKYYYETYLSLSWFLQDIETNGLPVDVAVMEEMTTLYSTMYKHLYDKMQGYVKSIGIDEYNPHYFTYTNSLFFDNFQLTVGYYKKKNKGKSRFWYEDNIGSKAIYGYKPSTNAAGMGIMYQDLKKKLAEDPTNEVLQFQFEVLKTQVQLNRINPLANKFLSKKGYTEDDTDEDVGQENVLEDEAPEKGLKTSYWACMSKENKIHSDYFPCLDNFRTSSTPNAQVAPAKALGHIGAIFKEHEAAMKLALPDLKSHTPRHIRHVFSPLEKDWLWLECDVSGADVFHLGQLSKDKELQRIMLEGNFHLEMARSYWNMPDLNKDEHPDLMIIGKACSFNSTYSSHFRSAAYAIQSIVYAESGKLFTVDELEQMLVRGWGRFPDYMKFKQKCEDDIRAEFKITNPYGVTRHFEPTKDFGTLARYINQGLAWSPASTMALHTHTILTRMRQHFKQENEWNKWVRPVCYVHDASYLTFHKDLMKDDYMQNVMLYSFCNTPTPLGKAPGMELTIGDRWKGKNNVFEAKTKWNKEREEWYLPGIK